MRIRLDGDRLTIDCHRNGHLRVAKCFVIRCEDTFKRLHANRLRHGIRFGPLPDAVHGFASLRIDADTAADDGRGQRLAIHDNSGRRCRLHSRCRRSQPHRRHVRRCFRSHNDRRETIETDITPVVIHPEIPSTCSFPCIQDGGRISPIRRSGHNFSCIRIRRNNRRCS